MNHELLNAALAHHAKGRAVIAVSRNKSPYHEGWNSFFTRRQTEDEVRIEFSNGAHGAALMLWPACEFAVLDFDGPHARETWAKTGIELPNTARNISRSGGEHLYFCMPTEAPGLKRDIRLVEADCECTDGEGEPHRCGVDLLVNGYAIIPPTPGYREDPDHPLEEAVEIPSEILTLATEKPKAESRRTGDAAGRVGQGRRNTTACSLAGSMRARGMSVEAISAALKTDNEQRFDPPLDDREIEGILKQAEKWAPGAAVEFEHLTDLGNARRLVSLYGGDIRFCTQRGWFTWTGKRWEQDDSGAVERLAKATVRSIYAEAAATADTEKELREQIASHAHKSENDARIRAMIALARTEAEVVVKHTELDADPWLLNVANGTLDLRTSELRPHRREDLITKLIDVDYYPDAACPLWLAFLERVLAGNQALIRFLQKFIGYCLTGSTREQILLILYGLGANGKSTLLNILAALLGYYAMTTRTETLMAKRGDAIPNDIARLAGARFVSAVETEGGRRLAESLVKQLTGGDRMTARFLHHEFFEFQPTFKLCLAVNHKPKIAGTDHAIWRRIRLIPFDVTIPDDERDPDLTDKLKAELPGILAWAVQGCELWQMHGLKAPDAVAKATDSYREESDPLTAFLDDRCVVEKDAEVGKSDVYKAFRDWAQEAGERDLSQREFNQRLTERGFKDARTKKVRLWKGLGVV